MKRILLATLVIGVLLLGACGAPTSEPTTTLPAETPPAQQQTHTLSVSVSPSGAGSVSPSDGQYEEGTQVTLTATPASGYTFDYWDGDASGSSTTVTITMDSDKTVIAHFSVLDTTPPVISEITASNVTESNATINWVTDEPATNQVEYGTTAAYGSTTSLGEELDTSHSVTLTELKPETTYHFRIKSVDEAGNEALSDDYTFTTKELVSASFTLFMTFPETVFTENGKVVVYPGINILSINLYNGSSQTITVTKVEILDGRGRVKFSSVTPDTVDPGEASGFFLELETLPSEDWQVKWYCLDANGVRFTVIGAYSSSD